MGPDESDMSITFLPGLYLCHDLESDTAPQIKRKLRLESLHSDGHAAVGAESPVFVTTVIPVERDLVAGVPIACLDDRTWQFVIMPLP